MLRRSVFLFSGEGYSTSFGLLSLTVVELECIYQVRSVDGLAYGQMFLTETLQCWWFRARRRLHGHEQLLFTSACCMECKKTRRLTALDAGALPDIAYLAFLQRQSLYAEIGVSMYPRTSFHRCLEILSMPVIGSIKTSFATLVSGTHIAQSR